MLLGFPWDKENPPWLSKRQQPPRGSVAVHSELLHFLEAPSLLSDNDRTFYLGPLLWLTKGRLLIARVNLSPSVMYFPFPTKKTN